MVVRQCYRNSCRNSSRLLLIYLWHLVESPDWLIGRRTSYVYNTAWSVFYRAQLYELQTESLTKQRISGILLPSLRKLSRQYDGVKVFSQCDSLYVTIGFERDRLGAPIHVGIILTILIWDQYHSKKFVLVSLTKNTFFISILS